MNPDNDTQVEPERLLYSAGDAAKVLSLSRSALYDGVSAGRIPAPVRIGGRVLWRRAELAAWVADGCPPMARWTFSKVSA
jgi:excisionase family DNA binding protein